ncbi:MAG: glycosyltransferase family 39 protein [Caldimonas sp.]
MSEPKVSYFQRERAGLVSVAPLRIDSRAVLRFAPLFVVLTVLAWVGTTAATSPNQWGDHLEQYVWAHGVEWGYHKHPPLPTWMLAATISLFGPSAWWTYVLAVCCFVGTALFTYGVGRRLFGEAVAALALLLLSLMHAFSSRASLFNHNSVMLLTVSATAWCVLRALATERHPFAWWGIAGMAAALAMLSKYQAVVPLAGIFVGASLAGELKTGAAKRGAAFALLVATALLVPHLLWLLSGHGAAIDYATQQGRMLSLPARALNVMSFLAQQLRFMLGPLCLLGVLSILPGSRGSGSFVAPRRGRAWLFGLVGFPLAVTVLTGPLFGIELQNHWGYQALQFATLWLAWRLRPFIPVASGSWLLAALSVHAVLLGFALTAVDLSIGKATTRMDQQYPAQVLADAVLRDWRNDTLCPLNLIVGPTFEAGMVSVYNGGIAKVLEDGDFMKSPWIQRRDLQRFGAVYVSTDPTKLPHQGVSIVDFLDVSSVSPPPGSRIYWAIAPPDRCDEARNNELPATTAMLRARREAGSE